MEKTNPNLILAVALKSSSLREVRERNGQSVLMSGSVGKIISSPSDNEHAYTVEFNDGRKASLNRHEMVVRKHLQHTRALIDLTQHWSTASFTNRHFSLHCRFQSFWIAYRRLRYGSSRYLFAFRKTTLVSLRSSRANRRCRSAGVLLGATKILGARSQGQSKRSGVSLHTDDRACIAFSGGVARKQAAFSIKAHLPNI